MKLLFTMFPYKFQSGTDSSYEMLRFVVVISKHYSEMTTEPAINHSVNVRLLCFIFEVFFSVALRPNAGHGLHIFEVF